jgi:hypothetical protein
MRVAPQLGSAVLLAAAVVTATTAGASAQRGDAAVTVVPSGVVSPGPLGVPYSRWAAEWFEAMIPPKSGSEACAAGEQGSVFFLPARDGDPDLISEGSLSCAVRSDQHVLVVVAGNPCLFVPVEGGTARSRAREDQRGKANAFDCLTGEDFRFADPYLTVDGVAIPIDERFFVLDVPAQGPPWRFLRAWPVMLEPLAPGSHPIEFGITVSSNDPPDEFRQTVVLEVMEPGS